MENIALNRERLKKANLVLFFIFYKGGYVCLHCHGAMQAIFVYIFAMTAAILNYET